MKNIAIIGLLLAVLVATGCATMGPRDNANLVANTAIGATVGALIGAAVGGGEGAAIGSAIGGALWAGNTPLEAQGGRTYFQTPYSPVLIGTPGPAYAPHGSYSYSSSNSSYKSSYKHGRNKSKSRNTYSNYSYSW